MDTGERSCNPRGAPAHWTCTDKRDTHYGERRDEHHSPRQAEVSGKEEVGKKGGLVGGKRRGKINQEQSRLMYRPKRGLLWTLGGGGHSTHLCSHSHLPRRVKPQRAPDKTPLHCKAFPIQQEVFGARDWSETRAISPSQGLSSKTREEGSSEKRPGLSLATEKGRKPTS